MQVLGEYGYRIGIIIDSLKARRMLACGYQTSVLCEVKDDLYSECVQMRISDDIQTLQFSAVVCATLLQYYH